MERGAWSVRPAAARQAASYAVRESFGPLNVAHKGTVIVHSFSSRQSCARDASKTSKTMEREIAGNSGNKRDRAGGKRDANETEAGIGGKKWEASE